MEKKIFLGETGNRAEVSEEHRATNTEEAIHAMNLVRTAGNLYTPIGSTYIGSAVVHYYEKKDLQLNPEYFCMAQCDVKRVAENHADLGWKQLKSALMRAFGRTEPRSRN